MKRRRRSAAEGPVPSGGPRIVPPAEEAPPKGLSPRILQGSVPSACASIAYPVASLAKEVGLSSFEFTEVFKRMTGLTPHAYLIDQRIRRAREDLQRGGTSVAHVAARWGFSSPQHFATAFRRVLGIMPSTVLGRGLDPMPPSGRNRR